MPRKSRDNAYSQYGPRLGDPPQPDHWARDMPGFAGAGYLAHGFDCLAAETGMADGLSLLLRTCGLTFSQVQDAGPAQCREWYYQCYAAHSGRQLPGSRDVVATGRGIFSFGSGGSG